MGPAIVTLAYGAYSHGRIAAIPSPDSIGLRFCDRLSDWKRGYYRSRLADSQFAMGQAIFQHGAQGGFGPGFNLEVADNFNPQEERWAEPQVLIQNGRILFTPVEWSRIMCLDLLTGETRWDQARGTGRYIAGVYKDRAIIVTNTVCML